MTIMRPHDTVQIGRRETLLAIDASVLTHAALTCQLQGVHSVSVAVVTVARTDVFPLKLRTPSRLKAARCWCFPLGSIRAKGGAQDAHIWL